MSVNRRPQWLKVKLSSNAAYREVRELIDSRNLHTVCKSARCPNVGDCWSRRTATFMILGDICSRRCRFCAVTQGNPTAPDFSEPERLAEAVEQLGLRHVVITSVTRDDLADGGSEIFARSIRAIREREPGCSVEVLIPDFKGDSKALETVFEARPDILNHNLEVVPGLYSRVRPGASFNRSLDILTLAVQNKLTAKTGIMVGLGESRDELTVLFQQLADNHLDILTIGQYLQPTRKNIPVVKYYLPEEFGELKSLGESAGIRHVESGPLVRSSYHADEQIEKLTAISSPLIQS